jgi:hypothetical protein
MAELERVKADQKMYKAFKNMQDSTEKTLREATKSITAIDNRGGNDV